MTKQRPAVSFNGYISFVVLLAAQLATIAGIISTIHGAVIFNGPPSFPVLIAYLLAAGIVGFCWVGFFKVEPNEGKVLQLFGNYAGTEMRPGLRWSNPLYKNTPISLRVRNFESSKIKVNDASGSPIEIAAVVVWKVVDSAEAFFEVDNFKSFVAIQSESALRNLANRYGYESSREGETSLRGDPIAVAENLKQEIQERVTEAGVEVLEARITHLAYSTEIAQAMLRKQQAGAILAARRLIVQGAVEMVTDALTTLTDQHNFELDDERKASMVSNLLVVICSEQQAQPVVNSGSLY